MSTKMKEIYKILTAYGCFLFKQKKDLSILFHFFVVLKAQNNNPPRRMPPHMNNITQADAGIINPFLLIYT
jgi:hypothetical protein